MALDKIGSKLQHTEDSILSEGCVWQNKLAEIVIKAELS